MAAVREKGAAVRARRQRARVRSAALNESPRRIEPHLALLRAPRRSRSDKPLGDAITVATYNVHRWTGLNGRSKPDPARACFVISELQADIVALQEVLRPGQGEDPLENLADALNLHVTFAETPTLLMGDMNTWRRCKASRSLDDELTATRIDWPASFPSAGPVLALDRIYARGVDILGVAVHDTPAARRASDHLPVVATVQAQKAEPDA